MKKQKLKNLLLTKKTISKLDVYASVKGGGPTDYNCYTYRPCQTNDPECLEPTGVSACLRCMEEPTEGCPPSFVC